MSVEKRLAGLERRFVERCREDLAILEGAAADPAAADPEALRFCVHRLAGAAGTFGHAEVSRLAGEADDEMVQGRTPAAPLLRRLIEAVRALVDQRASAFMGTEGSDSRSGSTA